MQPRDKTRLSIAFHLLAILPGLTLAVIFSPTSIYAWTAFIVIPLMLSIISYKMEL